MTKTHRSGGCFLRKARARMNRTHKRRTKIVHKLPVLLSANAAFRLSRILIAVTGLSVLTGSMQPTQLELVLMRGEIVMVTRNSPTTFYEDRTGSTGYELELAQAFADHLGVDLDVIVADNTDDIIRSLDHGDAAFAAAGLTRTESREQQLRFTSPYKEVTELVIYRRGGLKPSSPADLLQGNLVISAASGHSDRLREWQANEVPALNWSESPELDVADLLHMVASGSLDFTLVDSNEFRMLQAYYPTLDVAFQAADNREVAWAFARSQDDTLYKAANEFFRSVQPTALLANLSERYYGHLDTLDYVGARRFLRQADRKLEHFKPYFQEAADTHGFDWRLLAAVGYQESHWNPQARSVTGVRGLMMLTHKTAAELGIEDRLDPQQSIAGGSLYLARLRERLSDVAEPDRTWLALAAYNVGFGHLTDARKITEEMGGNPDSWTDVKDALPLLSQKRYYRNTRHGYARGQEPVNYVQNIRRYYDVLVWNDVEGPGQAPKSDELLLSSTVTIVPPLL